MESDEQRHSNLANRIAVKQELATEEYYWQSLQFQMGKTGLNQLLTDSQN